MRCRIKRQITQGEQQKADNDMIQKHWWRELSGRARQTSNENKLSRGEREREWLRVKGGIMDALGITTARRSAAAPR